MRISDWSSDVCSSDLLPGHEKGRRKLRPFFVARARARPSRSVEYAAVDAVEPDDVGIHGADADRPVLAFRDHPVALVGIGMPAEPLDGGGVMAEGRDHRVLQLVADVLDIADRKSTRLNSSHYC